MFRCLSFSECLSKFSFVGMDQTPERSCGLNGFACDRAAGNSSASAIHGITIAPGAEAVINDVVGSQFGAAGLGALKIGHNGGLPSGVRILNDLRPVNQGTTGFFIAPRGLFGAATSGILPFLSQASVEDIQAGLGFRSNIGWFNPNLTTAGATLWRGCCTDFAFRWSSR